MISKKSKKSQRGGNNLTIIISTLLGITFIGGVWGIISYFKNSDSTPTSYSYRDQNPTRHTPPDNIEDPVISTIAPGHDEFFI